MSGHRRRASRGGGRNSGQQPVAGPFGVIAQAFCTRLHNKPASGWGLLAISRSSRDNAPARWITTLSMGALLVLPQRYSVYQVRSGRKQPEQTTCVPGCSWQGPHPILGILVFFFLFSSVPVFPHSAKKHLAHFAYRSVLPDYCTPESCQHDK